MSALLYHTCPPKIRAAGSVSWLELPLPSWDDFMDARRSFRSIWKEMHDDSSKRVGAARHRRRFAFGYARGYLSLGQAAALLAVLEQEVVDFIARTPAPGEMCVAGPPRIYPCRVVSDLPDSAHLMMGYEIEIELEVIGADAADPDWAGTIGADAGGQETHEATYALGSVSGTVNVAYEMFQNPDAMELLYDGQVVASTGGPVSGQGVLSFEYVAGTGPAEFTVRVIAPNAGTVWNYTVYCPIPA